MFTFPEPVAPWQWYAEKQTPVLALLPETANTQVFSNYQTIFLFEYLSDIADPNRQIAATITQAGFVETDFLQYPGIGKIHILSKTQSYALKAH